MALDDSFKKIVIVRDIVKPFHDEHGILTISLFDFLLCGEMNIENLSSDSFFFHYCPTNGTVLCYKKASLMAFDDSSKNRHCPGHREAFPR